MNKRSVYRVQSAALPAVSLFSNCGAGDLGYAGAGFRFALMAELHPRRLEVALKNHPGAVGISGDLRKTWLDVVEAYRGIGVSNDLALLAACPPCQGLSSARSSRGHESDPDAGSRDNRNLLVSVIAEVARALMPRAVVVENVSAFLTRKVRHPVTGTPVSAARLLIDELSGDYAVYPFRADLSEFGVPQTRVRSFLTFFRREERAVRRLTQAKKAPYPRPTRPPEYGGEGEVSLGVALEPFKDRPLDAATREGARDPNDPLHCVPVWPDRRYEMVAAIPSGSGDSAWNNAKCAMCGHVSEDVASAICTECGEVLLRPVVVREGESPRLVRGFMSSYRRMDPRKPAATITTASGHIGSDHTIHPFENRVLSIAECAHLQTFPATFDWGTALDWGETKVRAMIGEAVPPMFTAQHGEILAALLRGRGWGGKPIADVDPRIIKARERLELGADSDDIRIG